MQVVSARRPSRLVQEGLIAILAAFYSLSVPSVRAQGSIAGSAGPAATATATPGAASPAQLNNAYGAYGRLPLAFEPNQGQAPATASFLARGKGYTLYLAGDRATLRLESQGSKSKVPSLGRHDSRAADAGATGTDDVISMRLLGANPRAVVAGTEELPGKANYFIGNDPIKWRTNIPTYDKVKYQAVYPGVDLVYYGNQGELEYDFVVAPGADTSRIRLALDAQSAAGHSLKIATNGDLLVELPSGEVRFEKPVIYQDTVPGHGTRSLVTGRYKLAGRNQVSFELGRYNHALPLVIDPTLIYSTYLGGTGTDTAGGIAVDGSGDVYVTGATTGTNGAVDNFPVSSTPYQKSNAGGHDVFVSEINPEGTALLYSTYIGGSGDDYGAAIAIDSSGAAYVTGNTASSNFPVFPSATGVVQGANGGGIDAFVTKLNPGGSTLAYSTYLGGKQNDYGTAIAVNSSAEAYVAGYTQSIKFPTAHADQPSYQGNTDAFFSQLSSTGASLLYSTYFGGTGLDIASGMAVDASGKAYIAGQTTSSDLAVSSTAYQTKNAGGSDAFVAEFDPTQTRTASLLFATYLGGSGNDYGNGIALDSAENIYVTGSTASPTFPVTHGAYQAPPTSGTEGAFVTKFVPGLSSLSYSTYLGGSASGTNATGITVDSSDNAVVTGSTQASDFPTQSALQSQCASGTSSSGPATCNDAFVTSVNATGSGLNYSTYLGGGQSDTGVGIALDTANPQNAYVVGSTLSSDFPTTTGVLETTCGKAAVSSPCAGNVFVAKIGEPAAGALTLAPVVLPFGAVAINTTSLSSLQTTVANCTGCAAVSFTSIQASPGFAADPTGTTCSTASGNSLAAGANCTVAVTFNPTSAVVQTGTLTLKDTAPGGAQVVDLAGTGVTSVVSLAPASLVFSGQAVGAQSAPQNVTLTNSGSGPLAISSVTVTGTGFAETNTCGSTVAAGSSCTISVTFKPASSATTSGVLSVTDNATGSPQTVSVSGSGVSPSAGFSTSTLNFGSQVVNTRSTTPQTVTLSNTGNATLSINTITVTGTNAGEFTLLQKAPCGSSVAPGSSCNIQLNFRPQMPGQRSATLSIADNAPGSPQSVALTGTGADFTVAATPASATVNPGDSTTYIVTVAPVGGFAGAVTLSCTGQPIYGTCSIPSPGSVTLDGSSSQQVKFTVSTLAPAALAPGFGRWLSPRSPSTPWVPIVALLAMLSLLVLARCGRRRTLILLGAALMLATFWMSCNGGPASGNVNNPANNGTPPGAYTLTITGAAQGLGNSTTVTVVVN